MCSVRGLRSGLLVRFANGFISDMAKGTERREGAGRRSMGIFRMDYGSLVVEPQGKKKEIQREGLSDGQFAVRLAA